MRREWSCFGRCTGECASIARAHAAKVEGDAHAAIEAQRREYRARGRRDGRHVGQLTPIANVVAPALWLRSVARGDDG